MMTGLNHCARPLQIQGRVHETAANDGDCERNSEASIASSSQTSREAPAQPHFTPTSAASPASFVPTLTPHKKVKKVCLSNQTLPYTSSTTPVVGVVQWEDVSRSANSTTHVTYPSRGPRVSIV
jgi:hypothetical protein